MIFNEAKLCYYGNFQQSDLWAYRELVSIMGWAHLLRIPWNIGVSSATKSTKLAFTTVLRLFGWLTKDWPNSPQAVD